jgi:hypothetical protein
LDPSSRGCMPFRRSSTRDLPRQRIFRCRHANQAQRRYRRASTCAAGASGNRLLGCRRAAAPQLRQRPASAVADCSTYPQAVLMVRNQDLVAARHIRDIGTEREDTVRTMSLVG